MRFLYFPLILITAASAQSFGTSTITLGAGVLVPGGGYRTYPFHNGASFVGEYEVHLHRFLAANVGADNFVMNFENYSRYGSTPSRERVTLMPFGLRAVAPLPGGRAELLPEPVAPICGAVPMRRKTLAARAFFGS